MRASPGGLLLIQERVAAGHWGYSRKVRVALEEGDCIREDLERCVATGCVHKKENDERGDAYDGNKYTILGEARTGYSFYLVGKILKDDRGLYFYVITAHETE